MVQAQVQAERGPEEHGEPVAQALGWILVHYHTFLLLMREEAELATWHSPLFQRLSPQSSSVLFSKKAKLYRACNEGQTGAGQLGDPSREGSCRGCCK